MAEKQKTMRPRQALVALLLLVVVVGALLRQGQAASVTDSVLGTCTCTYHFGANVTTTLECTTTTTATNATTTASPIPFVCTCFDANNALLPILNATTCPVVLQRESTLSTRVFSVSQLCYELVPQSLPRQPLFLLPCPGADCGGRVQGLRRIATAIERTNDTCAVTEQIETCRDTTVCDNQCRVSAWSEWSGCSRTCALGVRTRTRSITFATNTSTCPVLQEFVNCTWLADCDADSQSTTRPCNADERANAPCANTTDCVVNCTAPMEQCQTHFPYCNLSDTSDERIAAWLTLWDPASATYLYRRCGLHATSATVVQNTVRNCSCVSAISTAPYLGLPCNGVWSECRDNEPQRTYASQKCVASVPWAQRVPTDVYDQQREIYVDAPELTTVCNASQTAQLCGAVATTTACHWPYRELCVCNGTADNGTRATTRTTAYCLGPNDTFTRNCTAAESRECTLCTVYRTPDTCAVGTQCVVDCNGTTGCAVRNSSCAAVESRIVQCDDADRVRYCGETAVGCLWYVAYNPLTGQTEPQPETINCFCGPMAVPIRVFGRTAWNYGRPCATALSYQLPCTANETDRYCNVTIPVNSPRVNMDPRYCLVRPYASDDGRLVPGSCPHAYTLRNCTADEVYRHCPLDTHIGCQMACTSSSTAGTVCWRFGECSVRRPCTSGEALVYCGKFGTACQLEEHDARMVAAQVSVDLATCNYTCELPWYGDRCRNNVNFGPCSLERGLQLCGGPWQWHTCRSLSIDATECICRQGYGNPVPTLPGRNTSWAYVDAQPYGYCAGVLRACANESEVTWYGGPLATNCTVWCATAQPMDCRLHTATCQPFAFSSKRKVYLKRSEGLMIDGEVPCATRTRYIDAFDDPVHVLAHCGRGGRTMSAYVTYNASGAIELLQILPGTCTCQAFFFASDTLPCDATYYKRACTTAEDALVPTELRVGCPTYRCQRLCYPERGTRPELCFAHAADECLDHVALWAALPPDQATAACGTYTSAAFGRCLFRSDLTFSRVCNTANVSCHCFDNATTTSPAIPSVPWLGYQDTAQMQRVGTTLLRPCDEWYRVEACANALEIFLLCGSVPTPFATNCTKRVFVSQRAAEAHQCDCMNGFALGRICKTGQTIYGTNYDELALATCGDHTQSVDYVCGDIDASTCVARCTCFPGGLPYGGVPCDGMERECTDAERYTLCGPQNYNVQCRLNCHVRTVPGQYRACQLMPGSCILPRTVSITTPTLPRVDRITSEMLERDCGPGAVNCTFDVLQQRCIPLTCVCDPSRSLYYNGLCAQRDGVYRACSQPERCGVNSTLNQGCRERRYLLTEEMNLQKEFPGRPRAIMISRLLHMETGRSQLLKPNPRARCAAYMCKQQPCVNVYWEQVNAWGPPMNERYNAFPVYADTFHNWFYGRPHPYGLPTQLPDYWTTSRLNATSQCFPDSWVADDSSEQWFYGQPEVWLVMNETEVEALRPVAKGELWLPECHCHGNPYAAKPEPTRWWTIPQSMHATGRPLQRWWAAGAFFQMWELHNAISCTVEPEMMEWYNGKCPITVTNGRACNGLGTCALWRNAVPVLCREYQQAYASCVANAFRTTVKGAVPVKTFVDLRAFADVLGADVSVYQMLYRSAGSIPANMSALMAAINIPPPGAPSEYASYAAFAQSLAYYLSNLTAVQTALDAAVADLAPADRQQQDYGPCTSYMNDVAEGRVLPGFHVPFACRALIEVDAFSNAGVFGSYLPRHVMRAPFLDQRLNVTRYYNLMRRMRIDINAAQAHRVLFNLNCGVFAMRRAAYEFDFVEAALCPIYEPDASAIGLQLCVARSVSIIRSFAYASTYRCQSGAGPPTQWQYQDCNWMRSIEDSPFQKLDPMNEFGAILSRPHIFDDPRYVHPDLISTSSRGLRVYNVSRAYFFPLEYKLTEEPDFIATDVADALACSKEIGAIGSVFNASGARLGTLRGTQRCDKFRTCYIQAVTDVMEGIYKPFRFGAQRTAQYRFDYCGNQLELIMTRIEQAYAQPYGEYLQHLQRGVTIFVSSSSSLYDTNVRQKYQSMWMFKKRWLPLIWYWGTQCTFEPESYNPKIKWLPSAWNGAGIRYNFTSFPLDSESMNITAQALFFWQRLVDVGNLKEGVDIDAAADKSYLGSVTLSDTSTVYKGMLAATAPHLLGCLSEFTSDFYTPPDNDILFGNECAQYSALGTQCHTLQEGSGSCEDTMAMARTVITKLQTVTGDLAIASNDIRAIQVATLVRQLNQAYFGPGSCQGLACRSCAFGFTGPSCAVRSCASRLQRCFPGFLGLCANETVGAELYVPGLVPNGHCCEGQPCELPANWTGRIGCVRGYFDFLTSACICDLGWALDANGACTVTRCGAGMVEQTTPPNHWNPAEIPCLGHGQCLMSNYTSVEGYCLCDAAWMGEFCGTSVETVCGLNSNLQCNQTGHGLCVKNVAGTNISCQCASSNFDTRRGYAATECPPYPLPGFVLDLGSPPSQCRYVRVLENEYTEPQFDGVAPPCARTYCDYFGRCGCNVPAYGALNDTWRFPSAPGTELDPNGNSSAVPTVVVDFRSICPPSICPYPYRRDDTRLDIQCACILDRYDWTDAEVTYEWQAPRCSTPWAPCQNGGVATAEPSLWDPHRIVCRCPAGYAGLYCETPLCPKTGGSPGVTCNGFMACDNTTAPRDCRRVAPDGKRRCLHKDGTPNFDYGGASCSIPTEYRCKVDYVNFTRVNQRCSGDLRDDGKDICVIGAPNQHLAFYCNCSQYRSGRFCEQIQCAIPLDLVGVISQPCNGRPCIANASTNTAACRCNAGSVLPLTQPILLGTNCEHDVTDECGYNPVGTPFQSICNNHGRCQLNATTGVYGCQCDAGYTGALCQLSNCAVPCAFGTCVPNPLSPSTSICSCTHPSVIGFNESSGQCTKNQCGNGFPSPDGTQCVCNDSTLQPPACTTPKCPRLHGELCGLTSPGDVDDSNSITYADGTRSTRYKYCTSQGQCVCNPFLYDTNSSSVTDFGSITCIPKCNTSNTLGAILRVPRPRDPDTGLPLDILQQCVCKPGYDPDTLCHTSFCKNGGTYDLGSGTCTCPVLYNGTQCTTFRCGDRGTANGQGDGCVCHQPWTGQFCTELIPEAPVCQHGGSLLNATHCHCIFPYTGRDCRTHECVHGTPGFMHCVCDTDEWIGAHCDLRVCYNGGSFNASSGNCTCPVQYQGASCESRRCGNGSFVRVGSSFAGCICNGLWYRDATGNCTLSPCGPYGAPVDTVLADRCACRAPYQDFGASVGEPRCRLRCASHANYSIATGRCHCPDEYFGLLCEKRIIEAVVNATNGSVTVTIPLTPSENVTVVPDAPGTAAPPPDVYSPNATVPDPGGADPGVPTTPVDTPTDPGSDDDDDENEEEDDDDGISTTTLVTTITAGSVASVALIGMVTFCFL